MATVKNLLIVAFILLTVDAALAAAPTRVTCGATLSGNRTYTLTADLDCSTSTAPITLRDRAVLNLNNHVYAGATILDGSRAQLRDGTVECILAGIAGEGEIEHFVCVTVQGTGKHTVQNVLVHYQGDGNYGTGIWVSSDNNSLTGNTILTSSTSFVATASVWVDGNNNILRQNKSIAAEVGFNIDEGGGNQLIGNYATLHSSVGYAIDEGNNNVLVGNIAAGERGEIFHSPVGFLIGYGSGNRLTRNVVTSGGFGIAMGNLAGANIIDNNIAIHNNLDLTDYQANCGSTWQNNIFETSSPACVGGTTTLLVSTDDLDQFSALFDRLYSLRPGAKPAR